MSHSESLAFRYAQPQSAWTRLLVYGRVISSGAVIIYSLYLTERRAMTQPVCDLSTGTTGMVDVAHSFVLPPFYTALSMILKYAFAEYLTA